jgi:hypothetical protein
LTIALLALAPAYLPWNVVDAAQSVTEDTPKTSSGKFDSRTPAAGHATDHAGRAYVGSKACARCHQGIYQQFSQTDMGRSIVPVTPTLLQSMQLPGSVFDTSLDRHFEVYARGGQLYQSEYATDAEGAETFRETHSLDWIIGSGENGFGGIVRRGDFLLEAPLSYYTKAGKWELSPGYEAGDFGFSRPMLAGCMTCHSGRSRPIPASDGKYEQPPFAEMAIGCENCHGPGSAHIRAMEVEVPGQGEDTAIVNPARLQPELSNNICMSCHQTGDLRLLRPGKKFSDFRPGEPLDHTLSILMVPPKPGDPQTDLLQHQYSMTLSKCYRSSGGRLSCITCHDPHRQPTRQEAPAYYAKKCLACHTEQSCTVPLEKRQHSMPPDDCAGCHMPKRDIKVISHSTVTNHRIVARPDEPLPEVAYHQTTPALKDLVHLNPPPGEKDNPPPALTLLEAYGNLSASSPEYYSRYMATLDELARTEPDQALVQTALGHRDLLNGKLQDAVDHLQKAMKLGEVEPAAYSDLAEALVKLDRPEEAVPVLERSIALNPYSPVPRKTLIVQLIRLKQYPKAQACLEDYVATFPQDSYMRKLLAMAKTGAQPQ